MKLEAVMAVIVVIRQYSYIPDRLGLAGGDKVTVSVAH